MSPSTLTLVLLSIWGCALSADTDLSQSAYLDPKERFHIEWQYSDTNITITAKVKTTGWFGIGFSPNGGMAGADIITAGFADSKPYLQDRYAERNGYPEIDDSQDVELLEGSQENGITTIKFTRKHNTCDDKDMPVGTDTMRVIYAISADGSDTVSYHTASNRGTRSIYLRRRISVEHDIPDDAFTVDVTVTNAVIPAKRTRYHCELKKSPRYTTKHHMIKVEPLIEEENLGIVHHILVYGCYSAGVNMDHLVGVGHDCFGANMPDDMSDCRGTVAVWAVGGGTVYYPDDAGFPLEDGKSPKYYMIEVHYDNPQLLSGKTDNSGLRITLTKQLRKYDAGIMGTGTVAGITVPPGVKDFKSSFFCTDSCTSKLLKNKVSVFGAYLHGHLAATQVIARQFRDGKELKIIDEDKRYDFNYQQYKILEKPIEFLPGDSVMVTCHYNTEGRKGMTYGGVPTTSEMCISYLYYYPAQDVSDCFSAPGWHGSAARTREFLSKSMGLTSLNRFSNYYRNLFNTITSRNLWSDKNIQALEDGYLTFPQEDRCQNRAQQNVITGSKARFTPPVSSLAQLSNSTDSAMCGPQASAKPITTANTQRAQPTKGAKPTKKPSKSSFNKLLNALKNIFG